MRYPAHIDNKKEDILVLGIGPTQGLEHILAAEKMHSISFTVTKKFSVCACITQEQIVIYLIMVQKFIYLKQTFLRLQQLHYV